MAQVKTFVEVVCLSDQQVRSRDFGRFPTGYLHCSTFGFATAEWLLCRYDLEALTIPVIG